MFDVSVVCVLLIDKFILSEQRDPIRIKQIHDTPQLTDWDRYAIAGYYRLAECDNMEQGEPIEIDEDSEQSQQWLQAHGINTDNEQQQQHQQEMELEATSKTTN